MKRKKYISPANEKSLVRSACTHKPGYSGLPRSADSCGLTADWPLIISDSRGSRPEKIEARPNSVRCSPVGVVPRYGSSGSRAALIGLSVASKTDPRPRSGCGRAARPPNQFR
jgi:hypothetical protein